MDSNPCLYSTSSQEQYRNRLDKKVLPSRELNLTLLVKSPVTNPFDQLGNCIKIWGNDILELDFNLIFLAGSPKKHVFKTKGDKYGYY